MAPLSTTVRVDAAEVPTWAVCLAGATGLAVAMGIGRFVFTPLLPLMQREGWLSADAGGWLAAANYVGYLLGALTAARVPVPPRTLVLGALLATAAFTAGAGVFTGLPAWLVLRLAAGVASAWALVGVSSWAVPVLARRGRADAGGWVFGGVGVGIAAAGGWVWAFAAHGALVLWIELGAVALVAAALVAWQWRAGDAGTAPLASAAAPSGPAPRSAPLVLCYGLLGFGYILPATYLPALARALIDDPRLFGGVWPVFGVAAAASTLLAGRAIKRWRPLRIWAVGHGVMALGCVLPLFTRSGAGLAVAALCVGGTFMVATMIGLQQARALAPLNPAPLLGRLSAAFATGQIAGPLVALALAPIAAHVMPRWSGIELTLLLAAAGLIASAVYLHRMKPASGDPP